MNFYIIDDDISVVKILQNIVEKNINDQVIGYSLSPQKGLQELLLADVDIVLIDFLMPEINGVSLVETVLANKKKCKFIMISQVRDSELREEAYLAGIEFFIDKPINIIEVTSIISKVKQGISMKKKLEGIQILLENDLKSSSETVLLDKVPNSLQKIRKICNFLGISSESGFSDILNICQLIIEQQGSFSDIDLEELLGTDKHAKKIIYQRIRRTIKKGMINLANLYIDDFDNELVIEYGTILYGYENIHKEVLFIREKKYTHGKISVKHFFDGLLILSSK